MVLGPHVMSFLSPSSFTTTAGHGFRTQAERGGDSNVRDISGSGKNNKRELRSRNSIAAFVNLVKDPVGSLAGAVGSWYEKDAQARAQATLGQITDSKKRVLYLKLSEAASYDVWKEAAEALDLLERNDEWKRVDESPYYDSDLVSARLTQLEEARESRDIARMVFLVRTALTRDLGRMGNVELYKHSHIGTKDLIERYIDSALETLNVLLELSSRLPEKGPNSHRNLLEQVISARQAFGRSALLLSGGGTFGMSHNGVLKTLWEHDLLPRIISGASAGSIVAAIVCTRTDEEFPDLLEQFCHGDLAVFEEEGNEEGLIMKVTRFLKYGHLYDISHLIRVMRQSLGDMTFQEAYNRTRRILNICVSSAGVYDLPRLLNYVTAPNVVIWSAVAASCSVPLIFSPAQLLAKDLRTGDLVPWDPTPQRWIDGSVDNDLPMTRLAELFNVNHFIVSQVNPHVVPFLAKDEGLVRTSDDTYTAPGFTPSSSWLHTATHLARGEALYRLRSMAEAGVWPNALTKVASILNQKYSGDITILPYVAFQDFPLILKNPTEDFMIKSALMGERATWPKLSRVRNHCAIELALDKAVRRLRTRVVFSSSQVDLRQDAYLRAKNASRKKHHKHQREASQAGRQGPVRPFSGNKRSMSQSSEPDASLMMATKGIKPANRPGSSASGNSGHSALSERKPHSLHIPASSVSTISSSKSEANLQPEVLSNHYSSKTRQHQHPVSFQTPPSPSSTARPIKKGSLMLNAADIASSGAETSGIYTSDDEDDGNETDGSATSTSSQHGVEISSNVTTEFRESDWQQAGKGERNLFPHASQPPTPMVGAGYRPFGFTFTPASPPDPVDGMEQDAAGGAISPKRLANKDSSNKARVSEPEQRYKQLFHASSKYAKPAKVDAEPSTATTRSGSEGRGKAVKKINALGLEIPIPGKKSR